MAESDKSISPNTIMVAVLAAVLAIATAFGIRVPSAECPVCEVCPVAEVVPPVVNDAGAPEEAPVDAAVVGEAFADEAVVK